MCSAQQQLINILKRVRRVTHTDFATLAVLNPQTQVVEWVAASGNRNQRYKRIRQQAGEGIVGRVFRSNRPLVIPRFHTRSGQDPCPYAILFAENLQSVWMVPIRQGTRRGALLVGCRSPATREENIIRRMLPYAAECENYLVHGSETSIPKPHQKEAFDG